MTIPRIHNLKKKGGRPRKHFEETKTHSISMTEEGWEGFLEKAKKLGINSRSELCDLIGKDEFELFPKNHEWEETCTQLEVRSPYELLKKIVDGDYIVIPNRILGVYESDIPILRRLYPLFAQNYPHPRFLSFLWFVRRMARSLGLITNTYENEELVQEVVLSSLFCVILRDYIFPDELITNILADTKLVAFYLLLKKAGLENTIKEKHIDFHIQEKVKNKSSEETDILDYVVISMEVLSKNFPDFYHVFEMRYIEGLTGAQIQRLLELRGSSRSLEDIAKNTGEALKQLRIFFHQLWETQKFDEETKRKWLKTTDVQKIQVKIAESLPQARYYYYQLTRPFEKPGSLKNDIETLKELEGFLQESRFNWPLDFGLGEFDHIAGHDIDRQLDREKIREIQKKIAKNITKELGVKLPKYLESLKAELLFCGNNLQDIKNILMSFIKEEFSLDLDEQFFLKEKLGAYHNDKHLLKRD